MAPNIHGSLLIAGTSGVLITGKSGSGKTALLFSLLRHCRIYGCFAQFVCDDQVLVEAQHQHVIGRAPEATAGLVEVYGVGPVPLIHAPASPIDLVVRLVPARLAPRFQEGQEQNVAGIMIPALDLAGGNTESATLAIAAMLLLPPFDQGRA